MQEDKKPNPMSTTNAVIVFIATMVVSLFLSALLALTVGLGVALVISELLLLLIPLGFMLVNHVDVKSYVQFYLKPKYVLLGLGFAFLLLIVNSISATLLTEVFGTSQAVEESNNLIKGLSESPSGLIAIAASLSLAGVCEEFLFRGVLQNALTRKFSFLPAVILSALIFGFFHFDPQLVYIISTVIAGLILGYIYHRWHSIVVNMVAHSTMNIIVLILLLVIV
jgi:membrane protease YdiL (CAAX protease family)